MKRRSSRSKQDPFEQARRDVLRCYRLRHLDVTPPDLSRMNALQPSQFASYMGRALKNVLLKLTPLFFVMGLLCLISRLCDARILPQRTDAVFFIAATLLFYVYIVHNSISGHVNVMPEHWDAALMQERCQNALNFLTGTYDLRAVGPLAEIFWLRPVPSGVAGALTRLLRVQGQNAESLHLSPRQWQCLTRVLTLHGDAETALQIAALDSLAASGQTRAVPAVTKLAQDNTRPPLLQAAAQNCLRVLLEQAATDTQRQTLLRPPLVPPAELLRPIASPAIEAPELLLRASVNGDTRS